MSFPVFQLERFTEKEINDYERRFGLYLAAICRKKKFSRNIQTLGECDSDDDGVCGQIIDAITVDSLKCQWFQTFVFNGKSNSFKLDTGADVCVLPLSTLKSIDKGLLSKIKKNNTNCEAFGGFKLKTIGTIKLKFVSRTNTCVINVVVMPDSKGVIPILGFEACESLGLVQRIMKVKSTEENVDRVTTNSACDSGT
ncbi:hypothetical protein WDU94_008952 [Cyamophila willieti]